MVRKVKNNRNRVDKKGNRVCYRVDIFENRLDKKEDMLDIECINYRVDKVLDLSSSLSSISNRLSSMSNMLSSRSGNILYKPKDIYSIFLKYRWVFFLKLVIAPIIEHPYIIYRVYPLLIKDNLDKSVRKGCQTFVDPFFNFVSILLLSIADCFPLQNIPRKQQINGMEVI